ncbi:lipopolysaccharide biosynthesis protein [Olivibacter domesticus]|uniref:Membrane protein involved in the export of O-antigen and teichoic acid n=1 Tax=Olivibacter domesticus TaxID=407022 RepID=A0A1H7V208_OLID1|nr:lipopolysaccharide biosynthesis protein [Olivibacter domesticus]SEM02737.1 Membrane protein involved in the export of O-antigen and teichoic acid [Olivibacter domesticus]
MSLKNKAFKGFAWNSLESLVVKGVSFIISILVARLVSPEAYGLIGMLTVFLSVSTLFIEGGFSKALVQRKDCTQTDFSTVFYFNFLVSILIYIVLFFSAPFIAAFYNTPDLILLTRVMGLQFIIAALIVVQKAKLLIDIDFKTQARINILAVLISGAVGLYMAYSNYGVWALVGQNLSLALATTLLMWVNGKWRPSWDFSTQAFREMFGFGSKILAAGLYSTILTNIYTIVIGKWYQSKALGYYTRANTLAEMSSGTLNIIITNVTFPLLTSIQHDRDKLLSVYSRMLSMTAFIIFPCMTLFAIIAEPFIRLFLTDKWLPATALLQWLCLAKMFMPISSLNLNLLNAVGRSDLFLKTDLSKLPVIVIGMIITLPMGTQAVVIGSFVITVISYFINAFPSGLLFGYGPIKQLKDCYKILLSTLIMAGCTYASMRFFDAPLLQLITAMIVALISYLGAAITLRVKEMNELKYAANKIMTKKKRL